MALRVLVFGVGTTKEKAVRGCKQIRDESDGAQTGPYWIDPNGGATDDAFEVWCEMDTLDGGWTRFNWITQALPASGLDPLGQALKDCSPTAANCFGRIPLNAAPTQLLVKNTTRGDHAAWNFISGNDVSAATLNAFQNKVTINLNGGSAWQPFVDTSPGNYCGKPGGPCGNVCDAFFYMFSGGIFGFQLDDDTGYCCPAFKLGWNTNNDKDDYGYMTPACEQRTAFGEMYYR